MTNAVKNGEELVLTDGRECRVTDAEEFGDLARVEFADGSSTYINSSFQVRVNKTADRETFGTYFDPEDYT